MATAATDRTGLIRSARSNMKERKVVTFADCLRVFGDTPTNATPRRFCLRAISRLNVYKGDLGPPSARIILLF